jgi:hypothetical protein
LGSPTTLTGANKVWTHSGLGLRDSYLDVLTGPYGSPVALADFDTNAEAERAVINHWISQQAFDLVPELFPEGSLRLDTATALISAVVMAPHGSSPFDPEQTRMEPFTRRNGSTVEVPTMHYDGFLPSAWNENYQSVELPFGGGALSLAIIEPTNLGTFENNLTVESLDAAINSIQEGVIHLSVPKWSALTHLTVKCRTRNIHRDHRTKHLRSRRKRGLNGGFSRSGHHDQSAIPLCHSRQGRVNHLVHWPSRRPFNRPKALSLTTTYSPHSQRRAAAETPNSSLSRAGSLQLGVVCCHHFSHHRVQVASTDS